MLKRLAFVAAAATALTAAAVTVPQSALAYRTVECSNDPIPRDFAVSDHERTVFVGVEQTTPLMMDAVGARLCFEINRGPSNVVGYDLGIGVHYSTAGTGVVVAIAHVCGVPSEYACVTLVRDTGVRVGAGDLPAAGMASGCIATVDSLCVGSPSITYGGDTGTPTITLVLNGIAVPVNITRNCVSIPPTTC